MERHDTRKRFLIGAIILLVGVLVLARSIGFYSTFIEKFIFRWEMIFISIGLIGVISHENKGPGFLLLVIGAAFYLKNYYELPYHINFWQLFLALMLIFGGIAIIFRRRMNGGECKWDKNRDMESMDIINEVAILGGGEKTIVTNNFRGGKILAVFGGSQFNMTRAKLAPGKNYIDVLAVFGGMKLVVPEDWNIKISTISIFGGFSDKHRFQSSEPPNYESQLIIKGFVLFGGGEIKSY